MNLVKIIDPDNYFGNGVEQYRAVTNEAYDSMLCLPYDMCKDESLRKVTFEYLGSVYVDLEDKAD